MRIAIAVFAATLLLTGCKQAVGPAPEAPAADAAAAAPDAGMAADAAATDAAAAPVPGGERTTDGNGDRGNRGTDGNGDRGNRGNDDREADVAPEPPADNK